MRRWILRLAVLAAIVAIAIGARAWFLKPEPIEVTVTSVERGTVEETITNTRAGTVKAHRRTSLSPESGGMALAIPFVLLSAVTVYYYVTFSRLIDARMHGEFERADPRVFARPFEVRRGQSLTPHLLVDRLPAVRRLLHLRERFGDRRLEAACARALRYDDPSYRTIKKILEQGQEAEQPPPEPIRAAATTFVRNAGELVGHLLGGAPWN